MKKSVLFFFILCAGLAAVFFGVRAVPVIALRNSGVIYSGPSSKKAVAITFDDGPHPIFTPRILDILDEYKIKATFFMIGKRMEEYPAIVKEVVARGHVIGNHTYSHFNDLANRDIGEFRREFDMGNDVILKLTGRRPALFRPPLGNITRNMASAVAGEGMKTIMWGVCADHSDAPTPELMASRVLDSIRPGEIVLIHDGYYSARWKDVVATRLILKGLREKGYGFVTVPELLGMGRDR